MPRKKTTPERSGEPRRTFRLELRAEPGVDPVPALRAALKRLLRDHGLKATRVQYGDLAVPLEPGGEL